jgi:hypothetical protein
MLFRCCHVNPDGIHAHRDAHRAAATHMSAERRMRAIERLSDDVGIGALSTSVALTRPSARELLPG